MTGPPPGFRDRLLARARWSCERCGSSRDGLTLSHKVARSRGGPWTDWNIDVLCGSGTTGCHGWVEAFPIAAEREGWRVPGFFVRGEYRGPDAEFSEIASRGFTDDGGQGTLWA